MYRYVQLQFTFEEPLFLFLNKVFKNKIGYRLGGRKTHASGKEDGVLGGAKGDYESPLGCTVSRSSYISEKTLLAGVSEIPPPPALILDHFEYKTSANSVFKFVIFKCAMVPHSF